MPLPNIEIQFDNGALGSFAQSPDGLMCMVANAAEVGTLVNGQPKLITGMTDVAALGIVDSVDNHVLYKALNEFYNTAGEGTPMWLYTASKETKLSDLFVPDAGTGKRPIETPLSLANGNIRGLLFVYNLEAIDLDEDIENGLFTDVWALLSSASTFANNYASNKKAPFFCVIDGYAFTGDHTELPDLTEMQHNRCAILIGDTESRDGDTNSLGTAVGLIGGRLAKNAVQVNIGKVLDGPIATSSVFIVDEEASMYNVEALHDKGYISFRKWIGKAGYYFTDDKQACEVSDDYHHITNRRVIDKAYRIGYNVLLDTMLAEIPLNNNGTIQQPFAKTIENRVQSAIFNQMSAQGELSVDPTDPNDLGVRFLVDLTNNVASSSQVKGVLRVRPFGYNRFFDVLLGFDINSNN